MQMWITFLFFVLSLSNIFAETVTAKINVKHQNYKISLPNGFCDYTNTLWGKGIKSNIKKILNQRGNNVTPAVIFRACDSSEKSPFPWGYLGVQHTDYNNSQADYNKSMYDVYANKNELKKFVQKVDDVTNKHLSKVKSQNAQLPAVLRMNENVIISESQNTWTVKDKELQEDIWSAVTVLPNLIINLVVYDHPDSPKHLDTKTFLSALVDNANNIKSINKS